MFLSGKKKSKMPDKTESGGAGTTMHSDTPGEKSYEQLIKELKDPDEIVRSTAAAALGFRKSEKAVGPLVLALKDKHVYVRHGAAWALGEIKSERAMGALQQALNDPDEITRGKAAEAIAKIRGT